MRDKPFMDSIIKKKSKSNLPNDWERDFKLINKNIQDVIFKQDRDLNITYVSPSVKKVFGYSVEEALQLKLPKLMTKESLKKAFKIYDEMKELASENKNLDIPLMEYEYIRKDGTTFWGELKVSFIYDSVGKIKGSIGILRNITKRKKYQDLLKLSENRYRQAFERAEFYKDLFTHDMTNILQNVRSYAELSEMILEGSADIEVIKQYMNKIKEQVIRSTDLIHNVKTLYDLDDEKVKLRSIDLKEVIPKVLEYLKDGVREKNIKIDYEILQDKCFIQADDLVIDVLENLLLNAIKHNENDQIKIKIIVDNHNIDKSQFIRIQIVDNARGIPDEMKKTLFDFKKDKKDYSRGPGIGLILVKKILDRYNGLIKIEDRIHGDFTQGSNFILNIPAAN